MQSSQNSPFSSPRWVNWIGLRMLYKKEVMRFVKVYNQTLIAPMITSLIFLAIFSLAIGNREHTIGDVHFLEFMSAGLIMMTIVQNAFANTSSSLIISKVMGTIVDYLMPPLSAGEITLALTLAGITRGIATGIFVGLGVWCFVPLHIHSILLVIFYVVTASSMLALLGLLTGIVTDTFDQMAAVTSYIVTPLAFLSGTFYSISDLPVFWQHVSHLNPFFYMIDGFRYSMTGQSDMPIITGVLVLLAMNIFLYAFALRLLSSGYRLKT